jgi:hypothetical protein
MQAKSITSSRCFKLLAHKFLHNLIGTPKVVRANMKGTLNFKVYSNRCLHNYTENETYKGFKSSTYLILINFMEIRKMLPRNNPYLKWIWCCKRNNGRKIRCLADQGIFGPNLTKAAVPWSIKKLLHAVKPRCHRGRDKGSSQHLAVWMCHCRPSRWPMVLKHLIFYDKRKLFICTWGN